MPSVDRLQNIKNVLGYAVRQRKGYCKQIRKIDERCGNTVEQFKVAGFIRTGSSTGVETYKVTELGDEYYKEVFGIWNYWWARIAGATERFIKRRL